MKRILLALSLFASLTLSAQQYANPVKQTLADLLSLGEKPWIEELPDSVTRVHLADSVYADVWKSGDTIVVIHTACVPECASIARVYNKEWTFLHLLSAPAHWILPVATIEDGKLVWHDESAKLLLDD